MNKILIVVGFILLGLTAVFAQKQNTPTSLVGKRVTFSLPSSWIVQKQEAEKTSGRIQILIPYPATDNTPHSANAAVIANAVPKDVTVKDAGDAVYKNQFPGFAVVNDIADGKNWRTLVWTAKNEVPYIMLDRYGVVNGVAVEFLVSFPLLEKGDPKWIEKTVADFNSFCEGLKIDGTNSTEAKVHLDKLEPAKKKDD